MEKDTIIVDINRYNEILQNSFKYKLLLQDMSNIIDNETSLSWDKEDLNFDDNEIRRFFKRYFPFTYNNKLDELKEQEK